MPLINSIINQFNPFSTSQLSDDQSESDGSWNSLPTDNNPSSTTQIPKPDPNSPSIPQFQPPSVTSSQAPSSQKQPSSIHDSQDTVQNGTSNIVQKPDPSDGKGGIKTLSITQVTLLSSGYLSLGCTSKSKRKKNMKKVINSIGGKRPMQIIIKSVDTKKMTTSIINPVRGEKNHY
ncbi:PIR protein CIR protein [Plasmodium vinckei brucechwatti]|uniref:PIR protein CIR protein n=1 Tax=Plasmodium vinckei brucechwatti TaxID=119398 RepID=A0A6V7SMM3_PLAVN|nr:PIR protein CIR protein [Plasmodium vinckei brucechwatti]